MPITIIVPASEIFDDEKQEFISGKAQKLSLEHSLVSISKWESKWCKPFLSDEEKSKEEIVDYIRCMTLTQNVDPSVYTRLTRDNYEQINAYISAPMTATWFNKRAHEGARGRNKKEVITSELIYYAMISYNIPFDPCQKWHINRLITLIRVAEIKNRPPKKMGAKNVAAQNRALNEARRKRMGSTG